MGRYRGYQARHLHCMTTSGFVTLEVKMSDSRLAWDLIAKALPDLELGDLKQMANAITGELASRKTHGNTKTVDQLLGVAVAHGWDKKSDVVQFIEQKLKESK